MFHHVSTETSAASLWLKLEGLYERKTADNKIFLIRRLVNLKFKDGGSVAEHINEVNNIANQLSSMKMILDDKLQALLLLSSLPDSYETLVVSLSNSTPDGKISMEQVTSCLFNEETRKKSQGSTHQEALVTQERGRGKNRKGGKARNKSRGKSSNRKDVECWNCGKKGHYKHECRKAKNDKKGKGKEDESDSTAVASDGDMVVILSVDHDICLTATSQDTNWVIDSGASFHVSRPELGNWAHKIPDRRIRRRQPP